MNAALANIVSRTGQQGLTMPPSIHTVKGTTVTIRTATITVDYHHSYDQAIQEAIQYLMDNTGGSIIRWGVSEPVRWTGPLLTDPSSRAESARSNDIEVLGVAEDN